MLVAAMRVAAGQIPHRDFYAIYGPGQFYVLAGLFKLFGQTILIERIVDLIFRSLVVLDSEFQESHEPNDSSRSRGVTLLDDYLHKKYRHIKTFGDQAIWQRV